MRMDLVLAQALKSNLFPIYVSRLKSWPDTKQDFSAARKVSAPAGGRYPAPSTRDEVSDDGVIVPTNRRE
jgi:hypothetical protein